MWKIFAAFLVFVALALFVLMNGGEINMQGEAAGHHPTETSTSDSTAPAAAK